MEIIIKFQIDNSQYWIKKIILMAARTLKTHSMPGTWMCSIKRDKPTIEYIKTSVLKYYGIDNFESTRKQQHRKIVQKRQTAMYFCRFYKIPSLYTIGQKIGNKDHATVLHAEKQIQNLIDTDRDFRKEIIEIDNMYFSGKLKDEIYKNNKFAIN